MHNATLPDLMAVVNHYNAIPAVIPGLDPRLGGRGRAQRLNLSQAEKDNLVAFLRTLTGTNIYTDQKWSDPFDENGTLNYIILPSDKMTLSITDVGTETGTGISTDSVATLSIPGVPNVEYIAQSSVDLETWTSLPVTASSLGVVTAAFAVSSDDSKCFYRVVYSASSSED